MHVLCAFHGAGPGEVREGGVMKMKSLLDHIYVGSCIGVLFLILVSVVLIVDGATPPSWWPWVMFAAGTYLLALTVFRSVKQEIP